MIIYKITNLINGKIYVGQTQQTLKQRIGQHKRAKNTLIGKAIKKSMVGTILNLKSLRNVKISMSSINVKNIGLKL